MKLEDKIKRVIDDYSAYNLTEAVDREVIAQQLTLVIKEHIIERLTN